MKRFVARSMVILVVMIFALAAPAAIAHPGHNHEDDGRIPGQPDFRRIGKAEFRFHPEAGAYTYKRGPNAPSLWFHVDAIAASRASETPLPTTEAPIACTGTGHRIRVMYSSATTATPPPHHVEQIRTAIRRMASKIISESLRSSANTRSLGMPVECDANGEIRIQGFKSSGNVDEVFETVDSLFGAPYGASSVKNLVFYAGEDPKKAAAGYGLTYNDSDKSSSDAYPLPGGQNNNRVISTSGIVYGPYWWTHTTLHELFHTMGAVQPSAPYGTSAAHCWDGFDVMCYNDGSWAGKLYNETSCSISGGFNTAVGFPLDCNYNTYFDAGEEGGEWLNTHWNVGGIENPFLVTPAFTLRDSNASGPAEYAFDLTNQMVPGIDVPVSGDWNGDGFDTVGFFNPTTYTWYLKNSNATGPADLVFQFGDKGDRPVVGDWNEDGIDTIGVYRPSTGVFFLRDLNSAGGPQYQFAYGNSEDLPISGDWNSSGTDTIGLYRPSTGVFYLSNTNGSVPPVYSFAYGNPGNDDLPVAGDWDENGFFSVGVYRRSTGEWFLDNELPGNNPISYVYTFGTPGPTTHPIVGDWNNSGTDTPGAVRK